MASDEKADPRKQGQEEQTAKQYSHRGPWASEGVRRRAAAPGGGTTPAQPLYRARAGLYRNHGAI